jgi:hypothetical protein
VNALYYPIIRLARLSESTKEPSHDSQQYEQLPNDGLSLDREWNPRPHALHFHVRSTYDWLNKIKQELEGLGMRDIWINGEENNRNVWREVSKRCMDIEI